MLHMSQKQILDCRYCALRPPVVLLCCRPNPIECQGSASETLVKLRIAGLSVHLSEMRTIRSSGLQQRNSPLMALLVDSNLFCQDQSKELTGNLRESTWPPRVVRQSTSLNGTNAQSVPRKSNESVQKRFQDPCQYGPQSSVAKIHRIRGRISTIRLFQRQVAYKSKQTDLLQENRQPAR